MIGTVLNLVLLGEYNCATQRVSIAILLYNVLIDHSLPHIIASSEVKASRPNMKITHGTNYQEVLAMLLRLLGLTKKHGTQRDGASARRKIGMIFLLMRRKPHRHLDGMHLLGIINTPTNLGAIFPVMFKMPQVPLDLLRKDGIMITSGPAFTTSTGMR